jgi:5'-methylthioadenosine phosphorylase
MVTDYDCWHEAHDAVSVDEVISNLLKNADNARLIVRDAIKNMPAERSCSCGSALKHAIITQKDQIPEEAKQRLKLLIGKYL